MSEVKQTPIYPYECEGFLYTDKRVVSKPWVGDLRVQFDRSLEMLLRQLDAIDAA